MARELLTGNHYFSSSGQMFVWDVLVCTYGIMAIFMIANNDFLM